MVKPVSSEGDSAGFYRLFALRLVSGLASGFSFSIYRSIYPGENHLWIVLESVLFLLIGIGIFQAAYMIISRPSKRDSMRFILTQIAAHYIGTMIIIPG